MKLLVCTQIIDRGDSMLGPYVAWMREFAKRTERVEIICLKKGEYELPENVRVQSLGKESMKPNVFARLIYIFRFYKALLATHGQYNAVFVHMNQEYILLAGIFWKLMGKRIYMWRNHYDGTWLTKLAGSFCDKVFCTSEYSYTAKFKNNVIMPVGVDVDSTRPEIEVERIPDSILFLARFDISKRPEILLDALAILTKKGVTYTATFVGGATDEHSTYPATLAERTKMLGIEGQVTFTGAVPNTETFRYYRSHEIFVNCSKSGMLDKTTFKAMASGCLVLTASLDLAREVSERFVYKDGSAEDLAQKLEYLLTRAHGEKIELSRSLTTVVEKNALPVLMDTLVAAMSS